MESDSDVPLPGSFIEDNALSPTMPTHTPAHTDHGKSAAGLRVDTATSMATVEALETDWNRLSLHAQTRNAFTSFGWYRAWARAHERAVQPHVLVLKSGDEIFGVAPLHMRIASAGGFKVRKLEFTTPYADYNDLVVGENADALTDAVMLHLAETRGTWDVAELRDLRDAGEAAARLEEAIRRRGLRCAVVAEPDSSPYMSIDGDAESMMQRLSGDARRTLRQRARKAEAEGLSVRIVEHPERETGLMEKLAALDRKKQGRSQYPLFVGAHTGVFQALFDALGPDGWLYVALLERGEEAVAFQFGFRCGDKLWDYTKAFDDSFSRFAPGTLLLRALLDYGCEHGFSEYDFLRGEEPYKQVWSTGSHRRFSVRIWSDRVGSRLRKFVYYDVKEALRRKPKNEAASLPGEDAERAA